MVPAVLLTIDIVPLDQTMDEKVLLELIDPCLNRLKELKGSFDRNTDIRLSVSQYAQEDGSEKLTARVALLISVGMQRALHLQQVFEAYHTLLKMCIRDSIRPGSISTIRLSLLISLIVFQVVHENKTPYTGVLSV